MAVSCKVGRPYHVADIDFSKDPDQEMYDKFYVACRALGNFETVVLARALGVSARTVRRWKYGETFPPRMGMAMAVVKWVEKGKPQRVITQAEAAEGIF